MITNELIDFIKQAKLKGLSDEEIILKLKHAGWSTEDIQKALESKNDLVVPKPPKLITDDIQMSKSNPSFSMWDAFEHILMFVSLYLLSTSIGLTLHFYVDKWFPGISNKSYSSDLNSWDLKLLRGYLASLIVSFPLFAYFFLKVSQRTQKYPLIRQLRARKFLIYLTLIITFLIVIGNVISIVYEFINGNVTLNFILHFIITVGISSIIFSYYIAQVKEDEKINV